MSDFSFYWHDYETFGADPSRDRPSQFAGVRTDADFNIIGDPLVIYCKPAPDFLPQPEACLITGITPQQALSEGVSECQFIRRIHAQLSQPGTCGVGYNSIRFDDEVTRYTLYRNFYDPYAREWQSGNSRWDTIDMVRVCRALRPEGIEWPDREDGSPSFKLEHLTAANGIVHEAAHDALSDVYATIEMARLVKARQPRLFDYLFTHRKKAQVAQLLDVAQKKPVLHTSSMFPASRYCTALVMPLIKHPTNPNAVICYDLSVDPTPLLELSAQEIRERVYTPAAELGEGVERIPLKTVHINRCPVVATTRLLNEEIEARLQLDRQQAEGFYRRLKQATGLEARLREVFSGQAFAEERDPDRMLYSGPFFSDNDKRTMTEVRRSSADELRERSFVFEDTRLPELLFRYRGRNFPETLTAEEAGLWREFCYQRLTDPEAGASITMEPYLERIESLLGDEALNADQRRILDQLLSYSDQLLA